jgi:hypothetical protein
MAEGLVLGQVECDRLEAVAIAALAQKGERGGSAAPVRETGE